MNHQPPPHVPSLPPPNPDTPRRVAGGFVFVVLIALAIVAMSYPRLTVGVGAGIASLILLGRILRSAARSRRAAFRTRESTTNRHGDG